MKWGLMARAEHNRGLGVMTRDMNRYLLPDKTAVVKIADYSFPGQTEVIRHGFPQPMDGYEDATVLLWPHPKHPLYEFDKDEFCEWAEGLDVVVAVETFYDQRAIGWLRDMGVRSVLYSMPEMLPHDKARTEHWPGEPDVYWYPSSWFPDTGEVSFPPGRVMHLPVNAEKFVDIPEIGEPIHIIHVGGKEALGDRNGSRQFANVIRMVRNGNPKNRLTVYSQTTHLPLRSGALRAEWVKGPSHKETMYTGAHIHVMPRRYGGLCLPVLESLSFGLGLVMTDVSPNNDGHWPCALLPAERASVHRMPCGEVQTHDCTSTGLVAALSRLCNESGYAQGLMLRARTWAEQNTWEARRHDFYTALHEAATGC